MLNKLIIPLRLLFLIIFIINLYGCGQDTSTRKPIDPIAPVVTATGPGSEATDIGLSSKIIIRFSKNISDVVLENITITELISNKFVNFTLVTRLNVIEITPDTNLIESTQYQVSVSGVKNFDGTKMESTCTWKFQTINSIANPDPNLTGVCGSAPKPLPGAVQNISATVKGANTIEVNWQAPSTGSGLTHYRIERSINDGVAYISLNDSVVDTQFIDSNAQTNVAHVYRITAGNESGFSTLFGTSEAVTPTLPPLTNGIQHLVSPIRSLGNAFGHAISFTRDGTIMAIGEVLGGVANQKVGGGIVHLYSKNTDGPGWIWLNKSIVSNNERKEYNEFGYSIDFSPDGSQIAIADILATLGGVAYLGSVQLYDKSNGWAWSQTIISDRPKNNNRFGFSVRYSPDGKTLAIAEIQFGTNPAVANPAVTNAGNVQLFSKDMQGPGWTLKQTLISNSLLTDNFFGYVVRFSLDGAHLIISEINASVAGFARAGTVQIFKKDPIDTTQWIWSQTLNSSSPAEGNSFGHRISISSDGTLAVSEVYGDTLTDTDLGLVHLYRNDTVAGWVKITTLTSNKLISGLKFGQSLGFSADGSTLAIGELKGFANGVASAGTVQLFRQTINGWEWTKTLYSSSPAVNNEFGHSLQFSPVGSYLAIFELYGDTRNTDLSGAVNIFDLNNLPVQ